MTRFLDDVLEVLGGDGAGVFHGGGGQGVVGDLVAACGVALAAGLVIPILLDNYTIRVAAMALYYVILASSWNLLLGYAGQLSFAHAAFAGIGAYTSRLLSFHYGVHPGFGVFIGGAVAAGIGWCLGRMCLRTRGPYLALMTLGFSETVRLILQIEHDYTRGLLGLHIPYLFGEGLPQHILGYFVMLALAVITIVVLHRLVNSEKGLYFKAIREDEDVAAVMGVELVKWKVNALHSSGRAGPTETVARRDLVPRSMALASGR